MTEYLSRNFEDKSGLPPDWARNANCIGANPELFFPVQGSTKGSELAKLICQECTIVEDCLHYALSNNLKEGIYGNTNGRERRKMLRNNRKANER